MNPELPPNSREQIEARMTAFLLGELPAHEAALMRQAIDEDADLAELCDRLQPAIKLVREAAANPASQPATPPVALKLSEERRQKLLAHFKTVRPVEFVAKAAQPERSRSWVIEIAAMLAIFAVLAGLLLPALAKSKAKAVSINVRSNLKQVELAKQMWADDNKKTAADAAPTFQELAPYLGGVHSVDGENYVPGKVGEPATAELPADKAKKVFGGRLVVDVTNERSDLVALSADGRLAFVDKNVLEERLRERRPEEVKVGYGANPETLSRRGVPPPASTPTTPATPQATIVLPAETTPEAETLNPRDYPVASAPSQAAFTYDPETKSVIVMADDKSFTAPPVLSGSTHGFYDDAPAGVANSGKIAGAAGGLPQVGDVPFVGALFAKDQFQTGATKGEIAAVTNSIQNNFQAEVGARNKTQDIPLANADPVNVQQELQETFPSGWARGGGGGATVPNPLLNRQTTLLQQQNNATTTFFGSNGSTTTLADGSVQQSSISGNLAANAPSQNTVNLPGGGFPLAYATPAGAQQSQRMLTESDEAGLEQQKAPSRQPFAGSGARFGGFGSSSLAQGEAPAPQLTPKYATPISGRRMGVLPEENQTEQLASASQVAETKTAPGSQSDGAHVRADLLDQVSVPPITSTKETETNLYQLNIVGYVNVPITSNATILGKSEQLASGGDIAVTKSPTVADDAALETKIVAANAVVENTERKISDADKNDLGVKKPVAPAPTPQPEVLTSDNAFSTFSLNVSDVSFKLAAASLEKGLMPEPATIRSEEFINAFDYRDPAPAPGAPLGFAWERARYPFAHNRDLLRFSVQTAAAGREAGRPLNLVLLLDNSGSMERADRVAIIHEALRVLAGQLQPQDTLSVVIFARTARLWVDGVPGSRAGEVAEKVSGLTPEGGTNLEEAMKLAYETARRHYLASGINRVVLLTDGAANLGNVDPTALKLQVEANRKQGIMLDCFGIGWEGYNDDLLEVLTRNGDGRYGFINTPEEAATGFAGQLAGALHVAAEDVKVQVEFNSRRVTAYRQIGYAKLQLKKEEFRDNSVAAAAIGAAESGNALYTIEVNPAGEGPIATVRMRFKVPGTTDYQEHVWEVPYSGGAVALEQSSPAMRLAAGASAFSEWLAASPFAADVTPDQLLTIMRGVPEVYGADARPKKLEWMIRTAKSVAGK